MSLILDHINGVPDDNRLENLQIVCPNCAATLAVACPFCTMMLDDGVKQTGEELRVADVAVLLDEALRGA